VKIVTRFAPSPTGQLHLGHAFSALLAHRFARERGGAFLLRIEDIDSRRTREEFVAEIEENLRWLGIDWDGPIVRQSERLGLYQAALDRLRDRSLVYPCFCTRSEIAAEIARSAAAPHGPEGVVYPGTCRNLPENVRALRLPREPHAWRLDMEGALTTFCPCEGRSLAPATKLASCLCRSTLDWQDATVGNVEAHPERFGDVVLARKDAPTSYHLAVTVDDAAQGVTDVVRGRDLFGATDVHRLLQSLLDLPTPRYHHHPLLAGPDGGRLAKRHGAPTLAELRAGGADPRELGRALLAGHLPAGYSAATT
jgi:glutamyl-Q tRNA(Asp) synthetase